MQRQVMPGITKSGELFISPSRFNEPANEISNYYHNFMRDVLLAFAQMDDRRATASNNGGKLLTLGM